MLSGSSNRKEDEHGNSYQSEPLPEQMCAWLFLTVSSAGEEIKTLYRAYKTWLYVSCRDRAD